MTKTNGLPPALTELIENPEARRVEDQVLALARGLRAEGVPMRFVARGLAGAICALIEEDYMKSNDSFLEAKHLMRELEAGFGSWRFDLELIEDAADEIERSRAAGGTGTLYQ